MFNAIKEKAQHPLAIGYLAVLGFCILLLALPLASFLDRQLVDQQFALLKKVAPKPIIDDIVVIGIDEDTINAYYEPLGLWHPHLANIFTGLAKVETKGVMLDFILQGRSYNQILTDNYDDLLALGLRKLRLATNMVVVRGVDDNEEFRIILPQTLSVIREENTGIALIEKDPQGIVRTYVKNWISPQGNFISFVGNMANKLGLDADDGYINYALGEPFDYVPMHHVSEWIDSGNLDALNQAFDQKLVLFGTVLTTGDRHLVPLPIAAWEPYSNSIPGILIHAQALRSLINDSLISRIDDRLILILVFIASLFWWIGNKPKILMVSLSTWSIGLIVASTIMLSSSVWLPIFAALLSAFMAAIMRVSYDSYQAWQERSLLKASFSGYVSPEVLKNIIDGGMPQGLGGASRPICVVFADIRDFTTRSENQPAHDVISFLNRYFSEMTEAIHAHGGTVDKFMGDGLMAFFGAPNTLKNAPENAFSACKEMLKRVEKLNLAFEQEGIEKIRISIGMHYGYAVIGHVGSDTRHEYTAIGDTVNIAARLEYVSKEAGYPIVCTAEVKDKISENFTDLGSKTIKGRSSLLVYGWQQP